MLEYLRHLVSMKRRRYICDGYDLDLSYITDRVVAMSYPAESLEAMFRNPMWQVQRFLSANHAHHFKVPLRPPCALPVPPCPTSACSPRTFPFSPLPCAAVYNLCAEQWYDPSYFGGRVERFPFDDHGVPALELVRALCESAQDWLDRCHDNIIVVHCKAGKGRTGVMVCCLLLLAGMTTDDALALYADRRTLNRAGVTIPSQVRYVRYWARLVADAHLNAAPITLPPPTRRTIQRVRVYGMTGLDRVDFVICTLDEADKERYSAAVERCRGTCEKVRMGMYLVWPLTPALRSPLSALDILSCAACRACCTGCEQVEGDVSMRFTDKMGARLFTLCFNTAFTKGLLSFFPPSLSLPLSTCLSPLSRPPHADPSALHGCSCL
ncbi:unnamed protein product [Closterium sp. Naga37s-1]|nr:unnamed protein product [Closterium sp. Naga37s-1]